MYLGYESSIEGVNDVKKNVRDSLHDAHYSYGIAMAKRSAESSQTYKPPSYVVGSIVCIIEYLYMGGY